MVPMQAKLWQALLKQGELDLALTHPDRLRALEGFRQDLVILCGEEPTVLALEPGLEVLAEPDEMKLVDDLAWGLKAASAALYERTPEGTFQPLAACGHTAQPVVLPEGLLHWLFEEGPLVRARVSVDGLTLAEAEALLEVLEALHAAVVIPLSTADGELWGLFVLGPPLDETTYTESAVLRLCQYGCAILRCLSHRRRGVPLASEVRAQQEAKTRTALEELWQALKPATPLRLLVVDEMPKAVQTLQGAFSALGFAVEGATTEQDALALLETFRPQIAVLDLSLYQQLPLRLLQALATKVPDAVLIGTTTGYAPLEASHATAFGLKHVLVKPVRWPALAQAVLEAALAKSLTAPVATPG